MPAALAQEGGLVRPFALVGEATGSALLTGVLGRDQHQQLTELAQGLLQVAPQVAQPGVGQGLLALAPLGSQAPLAGSRFGLARRDIPLRLRSSKAVTRGASWTIRKEVLRRKSFRIAALRAWQRLAWPSAWSRRREPLGLRAAARW